MLKQLLLVIAIGFCITIGCSDDETPPTDNNWPAIVNADGSGDFPTIQSAINAAVDGDTVMLAAGTFTGAGNRYIDYIGKSITVMAEPGGRGEVIIDCEGEASGFAFHTDEPSSARLEGVTIMRAAGSFGAAILCTNNASPSISNCKFIDCESSSEGGAMHLSGRCKSVITRCRFSANRSLSDGGAIYISLSSPEFIACTFDLNLALEGGAILAQSATVRIVGCTITQNAPDGVSCWGTTTLTVANTIIVENFGDALACFDDCATSFSCSDIWGNTEGNWDGCLADQADLRNNFSADPLFCDRAEGDFSLVAISPCAEAEGGCGTVGAWPVACGK